MRTSINWDTQEPLSEAELEETRGQREGLAWLAEQLEKAEVLEGPVITTEPSSAPISDEAFDLIVEFEVSSKAAYEAKYRKPIWPQAASGVTIGIGYDVGYVSKMQLHADWDGAIPAGMVTALERGLGAHGAAAKPIAAELGRSVDVPWEAAIKVHRQKVMPRWVGLVERALPNTNQLTPDCRGALVSLTYNRGASFSTAGDRYKEMRAIKDHMSIGQFSHIPNDLRSMKRLWPTLRGLRIRRDREAMLFERGLAVA
ncbi:hypothetical protein [Sinorhizobium sp. M4_45]|uniref:hypothetical protein n=1 Tax=Sinorhizobium sp. M4_45 TaxID=2037901 RepID=UPI000C9B81C0|nr:hypothetical protein [Sinorhizobium sp. M4_45]PND27625.1 hypothetical protein CN933_05725 [Sinorhizobium sp. M4_45]